MPKTQWHPAFCAAMRLELTGNPSLQFTNEFNLTEKPLEVDMLIIKKPVDVEIKNQIGEFFGEHNLLEYKSPTDHEYDALAFLRAVSYAYYYCDRYQTWDVTLSMVVSRQHFNLLKWFDSQGLRYDKRYDGIYTLRGIRFLRVQVIVTEELDGEAFKWLSALTDKLTEEQAEHIVGETNALNGNEEKRLAESIVQALLDTNQLVFDELKEGTKMTLMEYLKPEIDEYAEKYAEDYYDKKSQKEKAEYVKALLQNGIAEETIKLVYKMSDDEIMRLRKEIE